MARQNEELISHLSGEISAIVESERMELVDLEFKRERGGWILRVYIDKQGGVNLDDCARVSGRVSMMLDIEDSIPYSFNLEVSSPGLDRPIKKLKDFARFDGRLARIRLSHETAGRKKFLGRLAGVEGELILLKDESEGRIHRLPFESIASARLEIEL